jgi:hypothetical protein
VRKDRTGIVIRSHVARAAFERNGAGKHADRRTKRKRTRGSANRTAIADQGR